MTPIEREEEQIDPPMSCGISEVLTSLEAGTNAQPFFEGAKASMHPTITRVTTPPKSPQTMTGFSITIWVVWNLPQNVRFFLINGKNHTYKYSATLPLQDAYALEDDASIRIEQCLVVVVFFTILARYPKTIRK